MRYLWILLLAGTCLAQGLKPFGVTPPTGGGGGIALDTTCGTLGTCPGDTVGTTVTWNHTVTGSNTLLYVALFAQAGLATSATCTYNSVSMTSVGSKSEAGLYSINVFILKGAATGTHSVSCTGSSGEYDPYSMSLTGVNQTTPNRTATTGEGAPAASPISNTVSNAVSGDWVIDAVGVSAASVTVGTGIAQVQRFNAANPGGNGNSFGSSSFAATGSTTMTWTFTGTEFWYSIGVAIIPA